MKQSLYRYKHSIIGVITLLIASITTQWIIEPSKTASGYASYTVQFPYVAGISVGNPIYVMGVPMGKIEAIVITKDLSTAVTFSLRKNIIIPTDSPFSIQTDSIFGTKKLNIQPALFFKIRENIIINQDGDEFGENQLKPLPIGGTAYNAQPPLILNDFLDAIIDIGKRNNKEKEEQKGIEIHGK